MLSFPDQTEEIQRQLQALRTEHRALKQQLADVQSAAVADHLEIQRLKKRKLALKDQIARLESLLLPDIIA